MALTKPGNGIATLPLSPEQLAVLEVAGGKFPVRKWFLLEVDEPLDVPGFVEALAAVLQGHEVLTYRPMRVDGFRLPRLYPMGEPPTVAVDVLDLINPTTDGAMASASTWLERRHLRTLAAEDEGVLPVIVAVSPGQVHHAFLALDPLLLDEGSVRHLVEKAFQRYGGRSAEIPEFQYSQYVSWRRELEGAEGAVAGRVYWDAYVGGSSTFRPPLLCYRTDNSGEIRARVRVSHPTRAADGDRLAAVARIHETSVEVVLQALWWLLLARLTEAKPFIAGWQHDCRVDYEIMAGAVGVFQKMLPVFIDVTYDETVAQWLTRFATMARSHVEQQEYCTLPGDQSAQHHVVGFVASPGLSDLDPQPWKLFPVPDSEPGFELALHVAPAGETLEYAVIADPRRYSSEAAECLMLQYSVLLSTVLENTAQRVVDLDLVSDKERQMLLGSNWVEGDIAGTGLLQRIERWAEDTPNAPALADATGHITYRDLIADVRRKANWLRTLGVTQGSLVALVLPRSVELVSTLLAVWQAGGGYLPIEPDWPALRRQAVLDDAQPAVVVHVTLPDGAQGHASRDVILDRAEWGAFSDVPLSDVGDSPEATAYVLYTSGSTGKPKGVVIEHSQLLNYVTAVSEALELGRLRRWALVSTVAADLGNTALFSALLNGACLVVARSEETVDAEAFSHFIKTQRIDALKIVPSHLEALLECEHPQLPATIVLGGEAAPRNLLERIRAIAPHSIIHNHYGPTETTVGVMVHTLGADDDVPLTLPLSRVLDNNRIRVLDESLRLVPAGAKGEVYVGGAQLCGGYLNREVGDDFIADPFDAGHRLYRTRDLAYVLPGCGILLAGRNDEQLKIRGFRVSPAEVEAALLAVPGVRQAVVIPVSHGSAAQELGAFVIAQSGVDPQAIRNKLQSELPSYMVPARVTLLDEFPRLSNGKVDRQAMRHLTAAAGDRERALPKDPLEFEIAKSMADLLECEALGSDQDFFDLGAHSLMVIKLVARLRKKFNVEIAPAVVFEHATPAALASALRKDVEEAAARIEGVPIGALPLVALN